MKKVFFIFLVLNIAIFSAESKTVEKLYKDYKLLKSKVIEQKENILNLEKAVKEKETQVSNLEKLVELKNLELAFLKEEFIRKYDELVNAGLGPKIDFTKYSAKEVYLELKKLEETIKIKNSTNTVPKTNVGEITIPVNPSETENKDNEVKLVTPQDYNGN